MQKNLSAAKGKQEKTGRKTVTNDPAIDANLTTANSNYSLSLPIERTATQGSSIVTSEMAPAPVRNITNLPKTSNRLTEVRSTKQNKLSVNIQTSSTECSRENERNRNLESQDDWKLVLDDLLRSLYLKVSSLEPTREFMSSSGLISRSKLDYVITNSNVTISEFRVFEPHISDHKAIYVECNVSDQKLVDNKPQQKIVRNIHERNLADFTTLISNLSFSEIYCFSDVDACFREFLLIIQDSLDQCCPLKRLTIGNCKKTWVSDVVKRASMDLKNLYWLKVNLNSTSLDLEYRQAKKIIDVY
ncbi:hypothetical protein HHI36_000693 [Cryptolaemus montrouzieri]|uniref:Uncharacterized protein n=1 Tax=Cryptolaemus montrouzieri TaxID=559131 RepID=A0ABD2P645_9CUCU